MTIEFLEEDIITEGLDETEVDDTTDVPITPASTLTSQITKKDVTSVSNYASIAELPDIDDDGNVFLPSAPSVPLTVNVQNKIIESQSKSVIADTLGISAELIEQDHLANKDANAASMIYQITSLVTMLKSTDSTSGDTSSKAASATDSVADLLMDIRTGDPAVQGMTVDLANPENLQSSISNIVDRNVQNTGSTISESSKNNIASIASSVVSAVKNVSTTSNDVSTFKSMIEVSYAASKIVETIEESGLDVSVNVAGEIADASANNIVDVNTIFIPTRPEKGIIKIRQNALSTITESIIQDISSIVLSSINDEPVDNILGDGSGALLTIGDIPDPDGTIRPIVLNAITDIIFGNNENARSFIAPKADIGISLDSTHLAKEDHNLANVKFVNDAENIDIEKIEAQGISIYAAISQTGHTVKFLNKGITGSFMRLANRNIQYTDSQDTIELSGNSFETSSSNKIVVEDVNKYILFSSMDKIFYINDSVV